MAASTSREPHDILGGQPPVSEELEKSGARLKNKGKGKETRGSQKKRSATGNPPTTTPSTSPGFEDDPLLNWVSLTDSHPSNSPPIFTKDGSYYFSLGGSSVKIFATSTGQLVSTLSSPSSSTDASQEALTSVVLNPQNVFQIITGSLDGSIRIWDYLDATLIRTLYIGQPIHHICAHDKHKDLVFVTASRQRKHDKKSSGDGAFFVLQVSLKPTDASAQSTSQKPSDITVIGKTKCPSGLAISPSGNWLVVTAAHKSYVANLLSIRSGFTKFIASDKLTCLAFHPLEDYFATGDVKGNIRLWYCLDESTNVKVAGLEKKTQTASFHWHAHSVSSIAFTSNGAYLLSGGEESVLVIWQLHSGKKEFVPRLGSPVQTISITKTLDGGEEYLLGLTDATFVFVSAATLKMSRSYARIKLVPSDNSTPSSKPVPLAVHPTSSTFILPSSHAASVQMYSLLSSKIVSELEVSPSNRVSRRDEKPIEPLRVERTVVSSSGGWMASIDARKPTEDFQGEVYMKIWRWERKTSSWSLNTRIDRPHGLHKVLDLSFNPCPQRNQESFLVTTGGDGTVKTWRLRSNRDKKEGTEEFWVSRSSLSFSNEIPSHVSWSPDGSLLAVSLGGYVSLYDALTNIHRTTFTSSKGSVAKASYFVGRGRFLVIQGIQDFAVWDIVTHSVRFTFTCSYPIYTVVPHPDNENFAVFTSAALERSRVHIFSPLTPKPSKTAYLPFMLQSVVWYSPKPSIPFSLAGITQDWRFVLVGEDVKAPEEEGKLAMGIKSRSPLQRRTLFQDIFGKSIFEQTPADPSSAAVLRESAGILDRTLFEVPAYLAPPVESLFDPFIMGFLRRSHESNIFLLPEEPTDEDMSMEVDDSNEPLPLSSRVLNVEAKEVSSLVSLFQLHSLQPRAPPKTPKPKVNGVVKVNGVHPIPSPTPLKTKPVIPPPSPDPTASPMVNGNRRKRKTASDYL
ncbi:quinon protein alcohol dehydrogenase-like superfamily [Rhodocollybia butyracea]|uniref:Quinon protein alcohol dehydrogenase-like superfamily n=1 Tax=Rhodocollybia butyracea TaxID=206335 RepID=A0A9P5UD61_9AGAR|nr:quinon protein alcohol dehydrogenase-like superfamily [Rhodocollybia butyracea]